MQYHRLIRRAARIAVTGRLVRVNGEENEFRMRARLLHRIEDGGFILLVHFPRRSGLGGGAEDLIAQAHFVRFGLAAEIQRPGDAAQTRELMRRHQSHLAHMQRADAGARHATRVERVTGGPATAMGGKVEAVSTSATRPLTVSR